MAATTPSGKGRVGDLGRIFIADVSFGPKVDKTSTTKFAVIDGVTLELANPVAICTANGIATVKKFTIGFPADRVDPNTLEIKDVVVEQAAAPHAAIDTIAPAKELTFEFNAPLPVACSDYSKPAGVKKVVLSFLANGGVIAATTTNVPTPDMLRYWHDYPGKLTPPVIPDPPVGWIGKGPRGAVPPVIPDPVIGWIGKK